MLYEVITEVRKRDTKVNEEDVENLYTIGWKDGNKLKVKSGKLRGMLDIRDGNEGENGSPLIRGIPFYQKQMNKFVRVFARTFNEGIIDADGDGKLEKTMGHADGYKRNSQVGDMPAGIRFFTILDENGQPMESYKFINGADKVTDDITTPDNEYYKAVEDSYNKITAKNFCVRNNFV